MSKYLKVFICMMTIFAMVISFTACKDDTSEKLAEYEKQLEDYQKQLADAEANVDTSESDKQELTDMIAELEDKINKLENPPEEEVVVEENPYEESFEITYLGKSTINWNNKEYEGTVQEYIEETLNIEITIIEGKPDKSVLNLLSASNEFPDYVACSLGPSTADGYLKTNAVRAIPRDMIEKYAPLYYEAMSNFPELFEKASYFEELGGYSCLHASQTSDAYNGLLLPSSISYYRYDWLKNLGIEIKGNVVRNATLTNDRIYLTNEPFTIEEFEEIMIAFTNDDPDQNGENDTYGFVQVNNVGIGVLTNGDLMGAFGAQYTNGNDFVEENGKVKFSFMTEGWKEYLKFMNRMYEKGCFNNDFESIAAGTIYERFNNGVVGYSNCQADWHGSANPYTKVQQNNPSAEILVTPPLVGPDGKSGVVPLNQGPIKYCYMVGPQVDDAKLARILQLHDFINYGESVRTCWGEEGVHFYINYTSRGVPYRTGIEGLDPNTTDLYVFGSYLEKNEAYALRQSINMADLFDYMQNEWAVMTNFPAVYRAGEGLEAYNEAKDEYSFSVITNMVQDFAWDSYKGIIDVDTEWDNYIKELYEAGVTAYEDALNLCPSYTEYLHLD